MIWNQRYLLHALREFEQFCNGHRPQQGIANAEAPLRPLPAPIADPEQIACLDIRKRGRLGGILRECQHAVWPAWMGFQQAQDKKVKLGLSAASYTSGAVATGATLQVVRRQ
ncbi:hypothetical protein [Streptomyces sp. NPDC059916]|uniref:hypothetical protein n=1 Tax=Streptomyces sp. NPDC059916 TaxID=3347001 RepID=UPI0036AA91B1